MRRTAAMIMLLAGLVSAPLIADDGSMSVSPSVVMLRGETGQSTTQTLTFTNSMSRALSFEMKAQDAVVRNGTRVFVEPGTVAGGIAATVAFSPRFFTVAPMQSVQIDVTVTIPPKAAVRAIAVMCQGTTTISNGALRMTASIGTLMTFALAGDVIRAEASPLNVEAPTASSNLIATQNVANSGTEPVVATGMLAILDANGVLIGKQAIPAWRMLPGERTDVRVEFPGELRSGSYRAMVTYDLTDKTLTSGAGFRVQ